MSKAQKPFAVFDIDGTIFRSSLTLEATYEAIRKGLFPTEALGDINIAREAWQQRTSPDAYEHYIQTIVKVFMDHIQGVTVKQFKQLSDALVRHQHRNTYVYTRDLIENLRATHTLLAISGSPEALVQPFCAFYGFTDYTASQLLEEDGVYTGEVIESNRDKDVLLDKMIQKHRLTRKGSTAIGDSGGDIELLGAVEIPIAFNPDQQLFTVAKDKDWRVVVERKNVIYELNQQDNTYVLM